MSHNIQLNIEVYEEGKKVYIRFDNIYEGGYSGQRCQLTFEINIDGAWKQVPPGGSYAMN